MKQRLAIAATSLIALSGCVAEINAALNYADLEAEEAAITAASDSFDPIEAKPEFGLLAGTADYNGTVYIDVSSDDDGASIYGDVSMVLDFDTNDLESARVSRLVGFDENDTPAAYSGDVTLTLNGDIGPDFDLRTSADINGNGDNIVFDNVGATITILGSNADYLTSSFFGPSSATINGESANLWSLDYELARE